MSPAPRQRLKNKAPSKNILDAAKDLRRLEVLSNLNLITDSEHTAEKKAVEKYLGIGRAPAKPAAKPVAKIQPKPADKACNPTEEVKPEVKETVAAAPAKTTVTVTETVSPAPVQPVQAAAPDVTSPF